MLIIGYLFVAFGAVDLFGSSLGLDVWGEWIGIQLPKILWKFSAFIEMGIGFFFIIMGTDESKYTNKE